MTPTATPTATNTPTETPTATPSFPCLGPLSRELATRGGGLTGTTRGDISSGVRLAAYVQLTNAEPDTSFDFYFDVLGGTHGAHQFAGTFSTDSLGNASFTTSLVVPFAAATIDNELVLHGDSPSAHQYIRELFAPCPE